MGLQTPVNPIVQKTKDPKFPHLVFEYHENIGKVYAIETPGEWKDGVFVPSLTNATACGVCIAEACDCPGRFIGFVQTYLRGVKRGLVEGKFYQV